MHSVAIHRAIAICSMMKELPPDSQILGQGCLTCLACGSPGFLLWPGQTPIGPLLIFLLPVLDIGRKSICTFLTHHVWAETVP
jgi:hypothetical protein